MRNNELIVNIFYGHKKIFDEKIRHVDKYKTLTEIVVDFDLQRNKSVISIEKVENLIVFSDEYGSVNESVIQNFMMLIKLYEVDNLYIQNPPKKLVKNIKRFIEKEKIEEIKYQYEILTIEKINEFIIRAEDKIIGQQLAMKQIAKAMISNLKFNKKSKPLVLMFYGPSGVGKTETAKILSSVLDSNNDLFIKPFGMYQNSENINSLYGEKLNENSFAKELLDRETNVILIDEFDKANPICFSAFYQLFDEGIFIDKNYEVDLKNSIIICTSNYKNLEDIKSNLGEPIYYRFDDFIKFDELSNDSKKILIERKYNKYMALLEECDQKVINDTKTKEILIDNANKIQNARKIDNIVKDTLSLVILEKNMKDDKNIYLSHNDND